MRRIAIGLFVFCLMMNSAIAVSASGNYYKEIIIDHTYVNGPQTDFPMMINITDTDLISKAQPDGDDIIFMSEDHITQLDHEIESYDSSTGQLVAWVRILLLSDTANTTINMYYNNSSAINTENASGVWGVNASGIWLMNEGEGDVVNDSSGNGNHGNVTGAEWINGGLDFNGVNDSVLVDVFSPDMVTTKAYTMMYNLNTTESVSEWKSHHLLIYDGTSFVGTVSKDGKIVIYTENNGNFKEYTAETPISDGKLHTVVVVFDQVNKIIGVYVDGVQDYQVTSSFDAVSTTNAKVYIGYYSSGYFDGYMSDVHIYDRALSAEEIGTRYNNTNSPSTFSTIGAEQTTDTTIPVVNTVTLGNITPNTGDAILVTVNATDDAAVIGVKANNVALVFKGGNIWTGTITALAGAHIVKVSATDAVDNVGWNNLTSYTTKTTDLYNINFLPPISITDQFNLKDGRTLPIKFTSRDSDTGDFIYDDTVNVTITDSTGHLITDFTYGTGTNSVRISTTEEQYIVNFHTRKYALNVGNTYVIAVTFGEPDSLRGYEIMDFTLVHGGKRK